MAALNNQQASVYVQINAESVIHDTAAAVQYGKMVMDRLVHLDGRAISILIGSGGLDAHTAEPATRQAAENYAFPDILRILGIVQGGKGFLPTPMNPVVNLQHRSGIQ